MVLQRYFVFILSLAVSCWAGSALAQSSKPIRFVASDPGGSTDLAARLVVQGLTSTSAQQAIVENRGGGAIPPLTVAKAEPDGYTLLVYTSTLWVAPLVEKTPYSIEDFTPVTMVAASPNIIVVHPSVAASSIKELIALAKASPGVLNYASGTTGASSHIAAELFKSMAAVDIARIPYKAAGPALNDVISGRVQVMFATAPAGLPHVKAGRLKALAVTSLKPSPLAPGLATVSTSGLPGYQSISPIGIFAPSATQPSVVNRLYQDLAKAANQADIREKFLNAGSEVVANSPSEFLAYMKSDIAELQKVIQSAGITGQ